MRVLGEVAEAARDPRARARVREHAQAIHTAAAAHFPEEDRAELEVRYARVLEGCGA